MHRVTGVVFMLLTLGLAGCAGLSPPVDPTAKIGPFSTMFEVAAVRSDGFLVFAGNDLLAVTASATRTVLTIPGAPTSWPITASLTLTADGRHFAVDRGYRTELVAIPDLALVASWSVERFHELRSATSQDGRCFFVRHDSLVCVNKNKHEQVLASGRWIDDRSTAAWLSGDESTLLVASLDALALFDANTGKLLRFVVPADKTVTAIEHRGDVIVATHGHEAIAHYHRGTGQPLRVLYPDHVPASTAASGARTEDGSLEVHKTSSRAFAVTEGRTHEPLWTDDFDWRPGGPFAFSRDGRLLAVGCHLARPRVYEARTGKLVATFESGLEDATAFAFSPDGKELVCGFEDGSLEVFAVP
jgi:WD40 repeat protein